MFGKSGIESGRSSAWFRALDWGSRGRRFKSCRPDFTGWNLTSSNNGRPDERLRVKASPAQNRKHLPPRHVETNRRIIERLEENLKKGEERGVFRTKNRRITE